MKQFGPKRLLWLSPLFVLAAAFVTYMAIEVPVRNLALAPVLTGGQVGRHWPMAVMAFIAVLAGDALVIELGLFKREARIVGTNGAVGSQRDGRRIWLPAPLRIQAVPGWALLTAAVVSGAGLAAASYLVMPPLWEKVSWLLVPWVPVFLFEEARKYKRYGFYAVLLGLAALQVGHLGEHTAQVTQLLIYHGDLSRSHGVFGQLDFETVHFVWDTLIWVAGGIIVYRFWDNKWFWVSWLVASVHQVEHIYLFTVYRLDNGFWAHGGIAGIFGKGGLIGSPLARPYLHFLFNFLVVIPMLVGLWDETKRVHDRHPAGAAWDLARRG